VRIALAKTAGDIASRANRQMQASTPGMSFRGDAEAGMLSFKLWKWGKGTRGPHLAARAHGSATSVFSTIEHAERRIIGSRIRSFLTTYCYDFSHLN
jgi:hypothetical protein